MGKINCCGLSTIQSTGSNNLQVTTPNPFKKKGKVTTPKKVVHSIHSLAANGSNKEIPSKPIMKGNAKDLSLNIWIY